MALLVSIDSTATIASPFIVWHDLCDVEATGQSCVE